MVDTAKPREEFIPLKSLAWVSDADAACAMLGQIVVTGTLIYFFTRWRGLDSQLASVVWIIFGIGFAGGMHLIPTMNGDVVDMDEQRTGLRREGMYAGVNSFTIAGARTAMPVPDPRTPQ